MDIFNGDSDLYELVARRIMGYAGTSEDFKFKNKTLRAVAKEVALSSFYGIGPEKFAYRIRIKTGEAITAMQAKHYLDGYFQLLSGVMEFRRRLPTLLERQPQVTTPFGRTIYFKSHEYYHLAFNKIMQCTGSDINLHSQVDLAILFDKMGLDAHLVHLVHDEAIFEYKSEQEQAVLDVINYVMADRYAGPPWNLRVPIRLAIATGDSWAIK
jgi:DNA polymerase I-like protein with 3'-5' exonuclease and polymerase domains